MEFLAIAIILLVWAVTIESQQIQLVGGSGPHEGRVEVFYDNKWGTVCDDGWDDDDASVVCRQLGFSPAAAIALSRSFFGQGVGPVWWDRVDCQSSEMTLADCPHPGFVPKYCGRHRNDASVICRSLELAGGSSETEGRVMVWHNGSFIRVCSDGFGQDEAQVVCRHLGFNSDGGDADVNVDFGNGSGPVMVLNINCNGTESSLTDCKDPEFKPGECIGTSDASVVCKPVPLRLVGGSGPHEGRVEVFYKSKWGTVCPSGWDEKDASVVCRHLGFSPTEAIPFYRAYFGKGVGQPWLNRVDCQSSEMTLAECPHPGWASRYCGHSNDVSVVCRVAKLVGGSNDAEGRVMVWHNGSFIRVCSDSFGQDEAQVVCRHLGFNSDSGDPDVNVDFGNGSGPVLVSNINCKGTESSLTDCKDPEFQPGYCSGTSDASVICKSVPLRLVNGSGPHEGRLVVFHKREWKTVCHDSEVDTLASVVCRQLGYSGTGAVGIGYAYFGVGSGKILRPRRCNGSEKYVTDCKYFGYSGGACNHDRGVSVICQVAKLVGGSNDAEGRVMVWHNGSFIRVCSDSFGQDEAQVVCRHLGFNSDGGDPDVSVDFGKGSGPVLVSNINCNGTESSLTDCKDPEFKPGECIGTSDASVVCKSVPLRLVNGSGPHEGRLEVFYKRGWSKVCYDSSNHNITSVVCRQLGYSGTGKGQYHLRTRRRKVIPHVWCNGDEKYIADCIYFYDGYLCNQDVDVYVICKDNIRFAPTSTSITVIENKSRTVTCSADCIPPQCNINWYKDSTIISSTELLTLNNIQRKQAGNYICQVTNTQIPTSLQLMVTVYYPAIITSLTSDATNNMIDEDSTVNFTCSVDSLPPSVISWSRSRQGEQLYSGSQYTIPKASCQHTDYYTCTASNDIGQPVSKTIPLYVRCNCPEKTIISNYTGVNVEYRIPKTIHGQKYETEDICAVDGAPIGEIECFNASWGKMNFNENCNFQESLMPGVTRNLSLIAQSNLTQNVETNLVEVQHLTSVPDELTPQDVINTATILDGISKTDNITQQGAINFINIINNIQNSKEEVVTEANEKVNISNRLIATLDELELRIPIDEDDGHFRLVTNKTVVEVWNLAKLRRNPVIGLSVNGEDSDPVEIFENSTQSSLYDEIQLIYKTTAVGILLNKQFVRSTIEEKNTSDIRLSMRVLNSNNLFINDNNGRVNSKVISATLTVDKEPVVNLNGSFVTTVFFPQKVLQDKYREKYSRCVFWDFSLNNSRGGWSNDGCRYVNTTEGRDVCVCDHLTNFAVLLDYYGQDHLVEPSHQQALTIITYIGLILSIIGLGLTVLTFLVFKKLRESRPQQIMFNLALAMVFSWIVFLTGIKQTGDHVGCIAVAVLLHYFIMASFMWMLMEGILQYLLFVKVLGTHVRNFMVKATIVAWGVPVIPVMIMLSIDVELYNGGETYCWMGLQGLYYGFALPLGLILLANIVIYIMVTHSICSRNNLNTTGLQHSVINIRASFCCFIYLGLTWVFGFLAISDARLPFQYIFTVLNSLQGYLIFILFTARDKKVSDYWRQCCCSYNTGRRASNTSKTTTSL